MFHHTPTSQQAIERFKTPFIAQLNPTNRWVVLAKLIPWDKLSQIYYQHLDKDKGRKALNARIAIGSMIIKHLLKLSDRETIAIISENPYMQHFLGLQGYQTKRVFDASLFVTLRQRMGESTFDEFTTVIIKEVKAIKPKGEGRKKSSQRNKQQTLKGEEEEKPKVEITIREKTEIDQLEANKEVNLAESRTEEVETEGIKETGKELETTEEHDQRRGNQHESTKQEISPERETREGIEEQAIGQIEKEEKEQPKLKGKLKLDATVADIYISYPTDIDLVNKSREWSEKIIDKLYVELKWKKKPRTYRRLARKWYLEVIKKKKKSKKAIRTGLRKQLNCLGRNLGYIEKMLGILLQEGYELEKQYARYYEVIQKVYQQQQEMLQEKKHTCKERIVSLDQPYVRPIVRGKSKSPVEFGPKLGLSLVEGYTRIETLSWSAYHEGEVDFKKSIERYYELYGYYPELMQVDRMYATRENRQWAKEKGIRITAKALGRPRKEEKEESGYNRRKMRKEQAERNAIEGKIGQGKQGYRLNEIRTKTQATGESWISCIIFVMNLVRYMSEMQSKYNKKQEKYFLYYVKLLVAKVKLEVDSLYRTITNPLLPYAAYFFSKPYLGAVQK